MGSRRAGGFRHLHVLINSELRCRHVQRTKRNGQMLNGRNENTLIKDGFGRMTMMKREEKEEGALFESNEILELEVGTSEVSRDFWKLQDLPINVTRSAKKSSE